MHVFVTANIRATNRRTGVRVANCLQRLIVPLHDDRVCRAGYLRREQIDKTVTKAHLISKRIIAQASLYGSTALHAPNPMSLRQNDVQSSVFREFSWKKEPCCVPLVKSRKK